MYSNCLQPKKNTFYFSPTVCYLTADTATSHVMVNCLSCAEFVHHY